MKYPKEFADLINTEISDELIGVGNPASNILLIGKEPAIHEDNKQQREIEIEKNREQWGINICRNNDIDSIPMQGEIGYEYNPLYPYRGQKYKVRIEKFVNNERKAIRGAEGTSKTWYQYQKLWDMIRYGKENVHSGFIDFHEHCFSTELSTINAKYSSLADSEKRRSSIKGREGLLCHSFYQRFPIVILAVGHYSKEHGIDLESIFNTKWNEQTCVVGKFWYNIHDSVTDSPKLLIHTNHLSMVSDELIKAIAERCIEFSEKNNLIL